MSEQTLQRKILRWLRDNYHEAFIWKISDRWRSGLPDICMVHKGKSYFIELKIGRNHPTLIQTVTLRRIAQAGGIVGVCYSLDDVKRLLR